MNSVRVTVWVSGDEMELSEIMDGEVIRADASVCVERWRESVRNIEALSTEPEPEGLCRCEARLVDSRPGADDSAELLESFRACVSFRVFPFGCVPMDILLKSERNPERLFAVLLGAGSGEVLGEAWVRSVSCETPRSVTSKYGGASPLGSSALSLVSVRIRELVSWKPLLSGLRASVGGSCRLCIDRSPSNVSSGLRSGMSCGDVGIGEYRDTCEWSSDTEDSSADCLTTAAGIVASSISSPLE